MVFLSILTNVKLLYERERETKWARAKSPVWTHVGFSHSCQFWLVFFCLIILFIYARKKKHIMNGHFVLAPLRPQGTVQKSCLKAYIAGQLKYTGLQKRIFIGQVCLCWMLYLKLYSADRHFIIFISQSWL